MELDSSELKLTVVQIFAELSNFANGLMAEEGTGVFGSFFFPDHATCHHLLNTTTTQPPTLTQTNGNWEALIFIQSISKVK